MNAVKRCLALFAATVAIGACSGDPTADLAGKDLTIRATPGAVWLQNSTTQTLLLEAIDGTGAPAPGNWTAVASGVATVTADTAFEHTTTGHIGQGRQFIIASTAEGNGSVTFTGTGGSVIVPVRVAPNPVAFNAVISKLHPARANDDITVTVPAGLRFTSGTKVTVQAAATQPTHNGIFAPILKSMSPDSTQLTLTLAPNADGPLFITGIASVQTPTLTSSAATANKVFTDSLFLPSALSSSSPAMGVPITITAAAGFKFRPGSKVSGGPTTVTFDTTKATSSGLTFNGPQWVVVSRAADSSSITAIPPAGMFNRVQVDSTTWDSLPSLILTIPTFQILTTPAVTDQGADDFFGAGGAAALGQITAPTVTGDAIGYFDKGTWSAPDNIGDGCPAACEVDVQITYPVAGKYRIDLTWLGATTDVDLSLLDGAYNVYFGGSYLGAGKDETFTHTATAGEKNIIAVSMFAGPPPAAYRIVVTKVP